jgi:hypothetical protein
LDSHPSALFCTFLDPAKIQLFSCDSTFCVKEPRSVGYPSQFATGIKMNQASAKTCSTDDTLCHLHRQPTRSGASLGPRLASHPCRFLVNCSHPMSQMAGLGSYISLSARGPRS